MIIPSDQVLNKSVEYYDPSRQVVYLERDFWQKYFSMLLRDFSTEMGVQPTPLMKRRLASMVKGAIYQYWHTKFVQQQTSDLNLWREINRCFMTVANLDGYRSAQSMFQRPNTIDHMIVDRLQAEEIQAKIDKPADGSEVVDELVNDYSQMEFDSLREIEMEAIVEEASRGFYAEEKVIQRIRSDYSSGRFSKYLGSDMNFSKLVDIVFCESTKYRDEDKVPVGEVTLWNLLDVRELISKCLPVLQDFTIARFHNFYKQYSRILVFNRLVQRIGYDVCELMYKGFMRNMVFNYVNVYEYAFCTIFLCDFCKRSIYSRSKTSIEKGFISLVKRMNTNLFEENFSTVTTPFSSDSISSRSSKISLGKEKRDPFENPLSVMKKESKRDSIFSQDGGNLFSNSGSSDFVFGQK
jgi:hypothetical protein